jgi:hypothetical protein
MLEVLMVDSHKSQALILDDEVEISVLISTANLNIENDAGYLREFLQSNTRGFLMILETRCIV